MQKGIIVEQKRKHTIMMTSDGSFYKTSKMDGTIGEETSFEPIKNRGFSLESLLQWMKRPQGRTAIATLMVLLLILPFYSWLGEDDVHAYVNIDINPSVELSLNNDYKVLDIQGLNDDGRLLVEQLSDWKNQPFQTVSSNILTLSDSLGYIQDDHQILLGFSFVDQVGTNDHSFVQSIPTEMESEFQSISVASFEVPLNVREEAKEQNTSVNLMYASEVLEEEEAKNESESNVQSVANQDQDEEENQVEQQDSETQNKNIQVIEKFIQRQDKDQIPPGLKKKLDKYKSQEDDEPVQKDSGNHIGKDKDDDHPSNNRGNERGHGKDKNDDHPSKGKGPKHNPGKGNGNNQGGGPSDKKGEDWTPPGLGKKDGRDHEIHEYDEENDDDWFKHDRWERDDEDEEEEDSQRADETSLPPGLDNKEDDHPGRQNHNNKN
ncbi:anti-sigma factor domain-containing protein [Tenuibacillus multivorans]|uniref:RsgI N-terminal anti-sigma domain-containing protein n=1 Tax=Tenuibacillus multivorans TaxID=237069 RepID=A0A1H0EW54_9BACI|nr:anti-sigma factor domain-containing protein [Tenuibacillus multivorans]GEL76933.1 anti-sigma-I factor RsgI [Tenuibacillus multivorans]SDN86611.1 hypothetical protein SAMN05216498_0088 [Tenuibacillus multivorans]